MKLFIRPFSLVLWVSVCAALFFTGCKKDDDGTPQTSTGTISGVISPVGAITQVLATNSANQVTAVAPGNNGIFTLGNLPAGYYLVKFTPATGFAPPAERTANVTAGNTVDLGIVSVPRAGVITGKFRYQPEGVSQITATDASNHSLTTTLDANGAFSFENLASGAYTVSFTPATPRYVPPAPRSVTVTPGNTVSAGDTLEVYFRTPTGTATFDFDGVPTTLSNVYRFANNGGGLEVYFYGSFGEAFRVDVPIFTGVGTYQLSYVNNVAYYVFASTRAFSQTGTFVVTNYDPTAGTFSATFNFSDSGPSPHLITNGTCNILF